LTIVGIETLQNGSRRLLVFDPGYAAPKGLLVSHTVGEVKLDSNSRGGRSAAKEARKVLGAYRRDEGYFKRWNAFETLYVRQ